jgi:hypothetical protein
VIFFKKQKRTWKMDLKAPIFNLQDPFITKIKDMIVLGGVEVMQKSPLGRIHWRTVFYKGSSIYNLRKFAEGPWGMKDIRLVELNDGKIGVFTRPQGRKGRRGKIGFRMIESLSELTKRKIQNADIFKDSFYRGEWGGVNEAHALEDGKIGVIAHIANFQKEKGERIRHYYPIAFLFDPQKNKISKIKILARREDLKKKTGKKREDLKYIIFPGGLIREGKRSKLYCGISDAESYKIILEDPFLEYKSIKYSS